MKRSSPEEIAAVLAGSTLELAGEFTASTAVPVRCVKCGNAFEVSVTSFKSKGRVSCKYCSGKELTFADLKARIDSSGFHPANDYPQRVTEKFEAVCNECGETSLKSLSAISSGRGCIYCARNKPLDEASVREMYIKNGLQPTGRFPGGKGGWESICLSCGRKTSPHYISVKNGRGCKYCSGRAVIELDAVKLMREFGYEPLEPYVSSGLPWKSRCMICGEVSSPTWSTVRAKGSRCKFCNPAGINLNEPAVLYLVEHKEFRALKIGISGRGKNRVQQHERRGWKMLKSLDLVSGRRALEIEQSVKLWIRNDLGLPQFLGREEMPQGGATETFSSDEIEPVLIWSRVLEEAKQEGSDFPY